MWLSANSTRSSANISRGNLVCTKVTAPDCSFRRVCSRSATYKQNSKGLKVATLSNSSFAWKNKGNAAI